MPGTRINMKITALYGAIAAGILGGGGTYGWREIEENKNLAQAWEEIELLRPSTDAIEKANILPERTGLVLPMLLPWTANYVLAQAERNPDDPEKVCRALTEMQDMNRHYLEALTEKAPYILEYAKNKGQYIAAVKDTSPAEKALCPAPF